MKTTSTSVVKAKTHPVLHSIVESFFSDNIVLEKIDPLSFFEGGCLLAANVIQHHTGGEIYICGREGQYPAKDHAVVVFEDNEGKWVADADGVYHHDYYKHHYNQREITCLERMEPHNPDLYEVKEISSPDKKEHSISLYLPLYNTLKLSFGKHLHTHNIPSDRKPAKVTLSSHIFKDEEIEELGEECNSLMELGQIVTHFCQSLGAFQDVRFMQPYTIAAYYNLPKEEGQTIPIKCIFSDDQLDFEEGELGMFCISSGAFEHIDGDHLSKEFRVMINASYENLLRLWERDKDYFLDTTEFIEAWAATVTHELCHALEFIQHGHGITPSEIDAPEHEHITESGDVFVISIEDVSHGGHFYSESDDLAVNNEICEKRVERQGIVWLKKLLKAHPEISTEINKCANELESLILEKQQSSEMHP